MFLQQSRMLSFALMSALVVMALAVWFVLDQSGGDKYAAPPLLMVALQVLGGIAVYVLCDGIGYRLQPIEPGTPRKEAATRALRGWQSGFVMRFALCEIVALASLAGAFVIGDGGFVGYLVGAVISLALMGWFVWPGERTVGRTAEALEREGGTSYLREVMGLEPWTGTDDERPVLTTNQPRR